jgi:hypothetical protein
VGLIKESESFVLSVEDDGPGFELEEACRRSSGLGLVLRLAKELDGSSKSTGCRGPDAQCDFLGDGPQSASFEAGVLRSSFTLTSRRSE